MARGILDVVIFNEVERQIRAYDDVFCELPWIADILSPPIKEWKEHCLQTNTLPVNLSDNLRQCVEQHWGKPFPYFTYAIIHKMKTRPCTLLSQDQQALLEAEYVDRATQLTSYQELRELKVDIVRRIGLEFERVFVRDIPDPSHFSREFHERAIRCAVSHIVERNVREILHFNKRYHDIELDIESRIPRTRVVRDLLRSTIEAFQNTTLVDYAVLKHAEYVLATVAADPRDPRRDDPPLNLYAPTYVHRAIDVQQTIHTTACPQDTCYITRTSRRLL